MKKKPIQYTIRNVPQTVDGALRKLAVREGTSINAVALDALKTGVGLTDESVRHHDLDKLAGTWIQDDAFDKAVEGWLTRAEHERYASFQPDPWPKVQALLQAA